MGELGSRTPACVHMQAGIGEAPDDLVGTVPVAVQVDGRSADVVPVHRLAVTCK